MTHDEAKAEVEELYEQTLAIVGGGWNPSESSWGGCGRSSLSDNTDSWSRVNQRFGELNAPALTIAERVAEEWNRLGYSVRVETDDTLSPPRKVVSYPSYLTGTTPDGFGAVFTVGEGYADFRGYSRCVSSDPDPDQLAGFAGELRRRGERLAEGREVLANAARGVAGRWSGGARDEFVAAHTRWDQDLRTRVEVLAGGRGRNGRACARRDTGRSISRESRRNASAVGTMTRRFRGRVLTAAGAAILLGVLSACSAGEEGEGRVDRDDAKAEVEGLYEETLAVVGPGWGSSDAEWRGCGRSSLSRDADSWSRLVQRFGPLDGSHQEIAERVAASWNRLGYAVEVESDDTISPPRKVVSYPAYLNGTTADGFGVVFTVGENYADFSGGSRCVSS